MNISRIWKWLTTEDEGGLTPLGGMFITYIFLTPILLLCLFEGSVYFLQIYVGVYGLPMILIVVYFGSRSNKKC
jgi:hypothetical protein